MQQSHQTGLQRAGEFLLAFLVLGVLILYSVARFSFVGYSGLQYNGPSGTIIVVNTPANGDPEVLPGDRLLSIDGIPWEAVRSMHSTHPLEAADTGDVLQLLISRDNDVFPVEWTIPGFTSSEFYSRLINTWPVAYLFWIAGTVALVLIRPKNNLWRLLVAFNYVTAIWLITGGISNFGFLESSYAFRAAIWISLPIYLQFHWNLPQQIRKFPRWTWWLLYLLAGVAAIAQWLGWGTFYTYIWAFALAVGGSVLILAFRYLFRRMERRTISLIFFATLITLTPAMAIALGNLADEPSLNAPGLVLSMVALPSVYLYVVGRRQLGNIEFRANRFISLYLFLVVLVTISLLALPLFFSIFPSLNPAGGALIITVIATSLITVVSFDSFQRFIERRILGISQAPRRILENFAGRLSTSLTHEHLVELLRDEAMPNLLIRQSALIDFEFSKNNGILYLQGLEPGDLPSFEEQQRLASLGPHLWIHNRDWQRATYPISIGRQLRGLWILGRKDPDDYYSQEEHQLLSSIADQTAIALANISQSQSLRALHQADIERQEAERIHLARELHDDILHRIAELGRLVSESQYASGFGDNLEKLVHQVRILINGLRPPLVDQGLYFALLELAEELMGNPSAKLRVTFDMKLSSARFDPMIEQHIYRIVQQACENAVRHSGTKELLLRGEITENGLDLLIEDSGSGFALNGNGLSEFLGDGHFGLAGMQERADMIGAKLWVNTAPGEGTQIQLLWRKPVIETESN